MEGQVIISNGITIWTYLEDSEEVMVNDVDESGESISPTQILTQYNDSYKAKFGNEQKSLRNANLKQICLNPKDRKNLRK